MSENEVAELLGLSEATRKNWLRGGHFPGATKSPDGIWTFDREAVLEVQKDIAATKERNRAGDFRPIKNHGGEPPLL